ncbi:DNA-directed DNA polymerase [Lentibacillus sp. JNUCC-1]|uniref:DNA polymerase III subunit alpha n=1 Tax=Lentibacillus sp. JNUCC-1 TaxID=2654513 RepID=UPI0012E975A9|nr:DNA polymerase III subunit alpha [Lentibacillus sp. JNUCC-1]MUV39335.1 DNA-directed DNA polymerase [Lentibacillus sp. JNUCC-1]
MGFTHLQTMSGYSMLKSTMTVERLVKAAEQQGFSSLALTDEHVLHGAVSFYQACVSRGIKPVLGMTVQVEDENDEYATCILLAKNNEGYQSLVQLSTYIQKQRDQVITKENLSSFTKDLVLVLPASHSAMKELLLHTDFAELDTYIETWQRMLPEGDFYVGVEDHGTDYERKLHSPLKAYTASSGIKAVAINDVRYIREKDVVAYDCLSAIREGKRWEASRDHTSIKQRHLRSSAEMSTLFDHWPEAIEVTAEITAKCEVAFSFDQFRMPAFPVPENKPAATYLENLCETLLPGRYDEITDNVRNRLAHELTIIQKMGFSDYFLIVHDFIDYAKRKGIMVGPGRGSAAGSLVAYVLGITDVDPVRYNLLFERFLNPERVSMPDIDIDFSDTRRDEVIDYVREKYGTEHVAQIITFGTFAPRSLLRELIKTIGIDQQDAHFIMKHIPHQASKSIVEHVKASEELMSYIQTSPQLKTMFGIARVLEGLPRHISTHAAGVVISEKPLVTHVPLIPGGEQIQLTQYAMNDLEALGLLKMDFLGLRNLTLMERIVETVVYRTGQEIQLQHLPDDDPRTYRLLQSGRTNGVFQLESQGMQNVLKQLKPTRFEDIVAVNALYRPGPMEQIPTYIRRKHGAEQPRYPHPDLESILGNTYGVLVYQEQIMLIAHKMAGFTLGEADVLRRAVSKKKHELMDEQRNKFIEGSIANGYTPEASEEMFDWIVKFSNYGFNRSHAVAYSLISYQLAYLKAHYPLSFFAELLSSAVNQEARIHMYINEARQLNIPIYPPSINMSFGRFSVEHEGIRLGMMMIKGIGHQVIGDILEARKTTGPFKDLFDFCLRMPGKTATRKTLEALILAGAFDELNTNRASMLASIDQAIEQGELFKEFQDQSGLFHDKFGFESSYTDIEDFSQVKKLAYEKELLGFYLSSHPLKGDRAILVDNNYLDMMQISKSADNQKVKGAAIIESITTIRTKRGDPMAFLTLSDETGEMEAVVFPDLYREISRSLHEEMIIMFTAKTDSRNQKRQLIINSLSPFQKETLKRKSIIFIKIKENKTASALAYMREIANAHPGSTPIIAYHEPQNKTYKLSRNYFVSADRNSLQALKKHFGEENVVLK